MDVDGVEYREAATHRTKASRRFHHWLSSRSGLKDVGSCPLPLQSNTIRKTDMHGVVLSVCLRKIVEWDEWADGWINQPMGPSTDPAGGWMDGFVAADVTNHENGTDDRALRRR